ncbi:hypothetical protein FGLOB1_9447 [Fusarium globosum]|uniref:Uncharacterized protein n=1 Tax=Fusarium globosum TaxID=78864 RepID=A0A8H5Y0U7_9HYPO|nr:hypothetical protein FGLOB1_9447 [Fusarium globosum]
MAPNNNNNNKETSDILGSVSQYSSRYNTGAARRDDGKRGQTSSSGGIARKKSKLYVNCPFPEALRIDQCHNEFNHKPCPLVHENEDSRLTSTGTGSGDAKHLPSGIAGTNRLPSGRQTVYERSSSDSVSLNRLPSGRQNVEHLPSGSVSMVTPLPSNVRGENEVDEFPDSDLDGLLEADIEQLIGSARANEADEFSDLDVEDLTEGDFQQLESQALGQAPVVDEDDGQKTRENAGEEFLDSDLGGLSETNIQHLLDQAVPESAKAVDGGDSEAPVMDVGESSMSESIDIDAQILEEDRIDAYVSNVEDDGMECFIDEEFIPDDVRENEPLTVTEGTGVAVLAEQAFYDRAWIVCDRLCQSARAEREWDSDNSPLSIGSWNWFRKTEPGELANIVYKRMFPEVRRALSKPRPDVLDLLELPEPKRDDLADSCNDAGVYVFVCHAERKVDPRSGDLEAVDNDSVGCYTGQSIAMPQKNGREGMSLRFDQHRRELRRTIPELEEKAKKASTNVPRFYRTVVENKLEAHPRVVATLPRDGHLAAHAMLIETVIMIMTGSVSEESSNGLPTKDIVADIQEQLAFEGRLRYQPKTLNRALPVRQGFRVNKLSLYKEGWAVDKEIMESLTPPGGQPTEEEKDGLVCSDPKCKDPTQARKKTISWNLSAIARLDGGIVWLCASCRNREKATKAGKQAQKTLEERRDQGIFVRGLAPKKITPEMMYCRYDDCHSKVDGVAPQLKKGLAVWSIHPAHLNWVVCRNCKLRERKLLVAEEKKRRGDIVTRRGFTIKEDDKVCTEEGCGDPRQEAVQQRMEAGQMIQSGHIWYRHPMPEEEGRVLCAPCRKAVLQKMTREAILRALERPDVPVDPEDHENPTRLRGG